MESFGKDVESGFNNVVDEIKDLPKKIENLANEIKNKFESLIKDKLSELICKELKKVINTEIGNSLRGLDLTIDLGNDDRLKNTRADLKFSFIENSGNGQALGVGANIDFFDINNRTPYEVAPPIMPEYE